MSIIFTEEFQIKVDDISTVQIVEFSNCNITEKVYLPRIVINQNYIVKMEDALNVIGQMHDAGFYTDQQVGIIINRFYSLIEEYEDFLEAKADDD